MDVRDVLSKRFGDKKVRGKGTALHDYDDIAELMEIGYKGGTILEIGTARGFTAALWAQYAPKVITYDVCHNKAREKSWRCTGTTKKIEERILPWTHGVANPSPEEYNFAFIDGNHTFEHVRNDFLAVCGCMTVLFHDYAAEHPGVIALVDAIDMDPPPYHHHPLWMEWRALAEATAKTGSYPIGKVTKRGRMALWQMVSSHGDDPGPRGKAAEEGI